MSDDLRNEVKLAIAHARNLKMVLRGNHETIVLAEWGKHERAMRKKAEFEKDHVTCAQPGLFHCKNNDERHTWTDSQWDESVEKELNEST